MTIPALHGDIAPEDGLAGEHLYALRSKDKIIPLFKSK